MLPLDCGLDFDPVREQEFFAGAPARPAVFLIEPRQAGARPFLARTADLRRRLQRLLCAPAESSKRLNLRGFARRVRYRLTGSTFEQALLHYHLARDFFPGRCRDLARLRPPALLKLNLANEYPRCYVTRRILADGGLYYGPFSSRKAAEAFANEFLNLFKIRRCQIRIRRDPSFPGCIYSEMKMCLAPCFAGCSKEDYDAEAGRVLGFLSTRGGSLAAELERERSAASEALDFELASGLHRRLAKVESVLRGHPELPRRVDELHAVVLQKAAEENTVAAFPVRGGRIGAPFFLRFDELASRPRSVEEILRENLDAQISADEPGRVTNRKTEAGKTVGQELSDHLALLARWFYSKPRQGEILFAEPARAGYTPFSSAQGRPHEWPYRRILRACSRLLRPAPDDSAGPVPPGAPPPDASAGPA